MPETDGLEEHDFLPLLWERVQAFVRLESRNQGFSGRSPLGERLLSQLAEEARGLESFLDDYGARENATFVTLTELVSALRSLAIVGYTLGLMSHRTGSVYPADPDGSGRFTTELNRVEGVIGKAISGLLREIWQEGSALFAGWEEIVSDEETAVETDKILPTQRLCRTVSDEDDANLHQRVASICSAFLALGKNLKEKGERPLPDLPSLRKHVANVSDEQQCRFFEARIVNLVSRYDNFIRGSKAETEDPSLEKFRTLIGMMRRLGRVLTELIHLHERYERDVRSEEVRKRLAKVISEEQILDGAINFALHFVNIISEPASELARDLIKRHTLHGHVVCAVPDGVHMHVRPVSLIARIIQHHGTPVQVFIGDTSCYAGSVVQFLMTVGAHPDVRELRFEGDAGALSDIKSLFEAGLGESDQPLPDQLSYLGL